MSSFHLAAIVRFGASLCFLLLAGCGPGAGHTADAVLERLFLRHEAEFQSLLAEFQSDEKLTMIGLDGMIYAGQLVSAARENSEPDYVGMPRAIWSGYQRKLKTLRLVRLAKSDKAIEFKVDEESMWNGSSEKGYWFQTTPVLSTTSTLDSYRFSGKPTDSAGGHVAFRPIKKNWYLYLYVNG